MKQLRGLVLASHPGPAVAVTAIAVILGLALGFDAVRATLLGLAVLAGQFSIGWSNDWIDTARDRVLARQDKPIVAGLISPEAVCAGAFIALAASIMLSFALGIAAGITNVVFVVSAWSYNVGLKATVWSWLPYAVSFGLLPLVASFAMPHPAWVLPWVVAAGALLGVAAHFANVLPDLEGDRRTGIRGLPHRLGKQRSGYVPFLVLAVVAVVVSLGGFMGMSSNLPLSGSSWIIWAGLAVSLTICAVGVVILLSRSATRTLMRLIMLGALVDVTMLALTGTAMVAR